MRATIEHLIETYQSRSTEHVQIPMRDGDAILRSFVNTPLQLATGLMGSGKTSLLLSSLDALVSMGVPREHTLYFDLGDKRLSRFAPYDLLLATVDVFIERFPDTRRSDIFVAFDNISHVDGWGRFVHSLTDAYRAHVFVADACARWLEPDSFDKSSNFISTEELYAPQTIDDRLWRDIFDRALVSDVARKSRQADIGLAAALGSYALSSSGRRFSVTKACEMLSKTGLHLSRMKIAKTLDLLEDAHIIHIVQDYSHAKHGNMRVPGTVFAGSLGLAHAFRLPGENDKEAWTSQCVYLRLRARQHLGHIFSYRTSTNEKIDFICADAETGRVYELIAICPDSLDGNTQRASKKLAALERAMDETACEKAVVITPQEEGCFANKRHRFETTTLAQWLENNRFA